MDSQVTNEISGTVHGHVVQARDIENVHIHPPARALEAPRQLPPPPVAFVNRDIEVERVDRIVNQRHASGSTPVVVLTGGHGVGKTATSRYWAQTHGKQFGDGHLYADFQQVAYGGGPAVGDVVGGFLSAFGIPNEVIPPGLAERAALFRSSTAGKRVLVLLDDVGQAAQVQPLIPNSVDAVVLVTSRSPLEELVTDGAGLIRLRPLDHGSARALLAGMIGEERLDAEPAAVVRLVEICGGLPVALRICGARLAAHEERPVRWLVEELADEAARLERLGVTRERSLRVVFDDAYRALGVVEALVYRRLGLHPGLSFTHSVAAAASGLEHGQVGGPLERLVEAHLVIEERAGRFRFHDLLRVHARRVAESEESEEGPLSASDVRQAETHLRWVQRELAWEAPERSVLAIVCPKTAVHEAAKTIAGEQQLVHPDAIREIASRAIATGRAVHAVARPMSDEELVEEFATRFTEAQLTNDALAHELDDVHALLDEVEITRHYYKPIAGRFRD